MQPALLAGQIVQSLSSCALKVTGEFGSYLLLAQAWILDANIGKVTPDKDAPSDVDKIVQEIRKLHLPIASREWLYKYMEDAGYSEGLRLWMGSNLVPDGQGKYKWGFNIEGASGQSETHPTS